MHVSQLHLSLLLKGQCTLTIDAMMEILSTCFFKRHFEITNNVGNMVNSLLE